MGDKPIIFSAPMVRALLDGRKTQTRRVVKINDILHRETFTGELVSYYGDRRLGMVVQGSTLVQPLPYAPGDRLWVRETWRIGAWDIEEGWMCVDFRADNCADREWRSVPDPDWHEKQCIKIADELQDKGVQHDDDGNYHWEPGDSPLRWKPSIHMPRWASRLTLTVTDVRVQRVREISAEDAKAEGVHSDLIGGDRLGPVGGYKSNFRDLWNSLHGPDAWDANPWVTALTFDVHRCNIDALPPSAVTRAKGGMGDS